MNNAERLPGCIVALIYIATVIIWLVIGFVLYKVIDVQSFKQTIGWLILWNGISFVINSLIVFTVIHKLK